MIIKINKKYKRIKNTKKIKNSNKHYFLSKTIAIDFNFDYSNKTYSVYNGRLTRSGDIFYRGSKCSLVELTALLAESDFSYSFIEWRKSKDMSKFFSLGSYGFENSFIERGFAVPKEITERLDIRATNYGSEVIYVPKERKSIPLYQMNTESFKALKAKISDDYENNKDPILSAFYLKVISK